jgi:predicted peptidase
MNTSLKLVIKGGFRLKECRNDNNWVVFGQALSKEDIMHLSRMLFIPILVVLLSCNRHTINSRPENGGAAFHSQLQQIEVDGEKHSYYIHLPIHFDPSKKWPVILYLHAYGASGSVDDIAGGFGEALRVYPERFPGIVVFPGSPLGAYWIGGMLIYAIAALDQTVKQFNGDTERLYVTGVSMGGYGALTCAVQFPGKFAAFASVSGGIVPPFPFSEEQRAMMTPDCLKVFDAENPYAAFAAFIGNIPVWVFHGEKDNVVPVTESRNIYAAIKKTGGAVTCTVFPAMGHDIGLKAYSEKEFTTWLFSQKLNK